MECTLVKRGSSSDLILAAPAMTPGDPSRYRQYEQV